MSQPFSRIPEPGHRPAEPGFTPPFKRRMQPRLLQETWQAVLRGGRPYARRLQQTGEELLRRGKRHRRALGTGGGVLALMLIGVYALNATAGPGHSVCPASFGKPGGKRPSFLLLMDSLPRATSAHAELDVHYDVCGLASGTPYRGRIQLTPQRPVIKKKPSSQLKPLVINFREKADGVASRHRQPFQLESTKPGAYTLELSITDNQGRERKRVQKIRVQ